MIRKKLLILTLAFSGLVSGTAYSEKTIKFVPHADLKILDPIVTPAYISRNHGYMIYDTLFSMDKDYKPQPQMVEKYEISKDELVWTFILRDGLKWHDGNPVKAEDCVASLNRWGKVDGYGQVLYESVKSMEVVDDKTFKINLKNPFPTMLDALGKISSNVPFMMPKRVAETDHKKTIEDYTGSGPFIFKKDEWLPGSKVVYVKNKDYVPRKEPASLAAGGKVVKVDRVEWLYLPDATTTLASLQKGEIDYWERPASDLLAILEKDSNIDLSRSRSSNGLLRFNSLLPPFDNPKVRQAVMLALNQTDYLAAVTSAPKYGSACYSVFTCGSANSNDAMSDIQKNGSIEKAKAALKASGYDGSTVIVLHPTDHIIINALCMVAAEKLKAIGMKVELQAMDFGTFMSRRANRSPIKEGGWNIFITILDADDMLYPTSIYYSGDSAKGFAGWFADSELEKARRDWLFASSEQKKMEAARKIQERILGQGAWAPLGTTTTPFALRKNLKNAVNAQIPFFWNIEKEG